jgi:hypothetical protein
MLKRSLSNGKKYTGSSQIVREPYTPAPGEYEKHQNQGLAVMVAHQLFLNLLVMILIVPQITGTSSV